MKPDERTSGPFQVLLAGGGVAALEAALALRDLAADRISLTMIAPDDDFVYRPMTVHEPFAYAAAERYPLERIASDLGVRLLKDSFARADQEARLARTESGEEIHYDALLLSVGARLRARYKHAITIADRRLNELLRGLIQDIDGGYVHDLAFVVPPRMAWPLPIYELALMSALRAYDMNVEVSITVLTPEETPLAVFGSGASDGVAALLAENRIEVFTSAYCEIPSPGHIEVAPGDRKLDADRIVALPELDGPSVPGLPAAEHGFIPIDAHCRVRGLQHEYAAGDATTFAIKHGGIATHQADVAAQAIAASAGAPVQPEEFHPSISGILLTGGKPRYLRAEITGGHGFSSQISDDQSLAPSGKIAAKYLAPYLEQRDRAARRS